MSDAVVAEPKLVVADTGPLLCAGAFPRAMGLSLLHKRKGRLLIPQIVKNELVYLANPRRHSHTQVLINAAARMTARGPMDLLNVEGARPSAAERRPVRQAILAAETTIAARQGRPPKLDGHDGEVDAILLAEAQGAILLTNDHSALIVAAQRGVTVTTYAGLLNAEIEARQFTAVEAVDECRRLAKEQIYCGLRQLNALALTAVHVPPGL